VLAGPGAARSIVDPSQAAVFKQEGLERMVRYDTSRRKSLVDHFWDCDVAAAAVVAGEAAERGDFAGGHYEASIHQEPGRVQALLARAGNAWGVPFRLSKTLSLEAGSGMLEIAYRIEGMPSDYRGHLGVEFNVAGLPAGAEGRRFQDLDGGDLGDLGATLDLPDCQGLRLVDGWLDIGVSLAISPASDGGQAGIWTFPIQTVSQSEGGFELVHQSVVVMPHWIITPDAEGRWQVAMRLSLSRQRGPASRSAG